MLTVPSITEQRALLGLTTPTGAERSLVWSQVTIPQAGISPEDGGYIPHRIVKRLHDGPWRYVAVGGGLRMGKSLGAAMEGLAWMPHSNLIWLAAEKYDLCRQEFEFMAEAATSLDYVGAITMPQNKYQPCAMETQWGCRIETRSLHDLGAASGSSLVARPPDLIIICEPGFAPAETLQQARERLTTRRGRLWMAGTFERANTWFVDTWNAWKTWPNIAMGKSLAVPSWLNLRSFPGGRHDPEIEAMRVSYPNIREFLVRWGGVPFASEALVMSAYWDAKRHIMPELKFQSHDHNGRKLQVELAIDPGYSGKSVYSVLVIQRFGEQVCIVDEIAAQTLVHEEVIDICRTRPWWSHISGGIIDPYAGVNHVYGGPSPEEIWWRYGKIPIQPSIRLSVEDALGRMQRVMRDPGTGKSHLQVAPKCERLIWEMAHWRRIQTREGLGEPSKINCDAAKALAYWCSAKYTEEALGYNPATEGITTNDYIITGFSGGESGRETSRADRYAYYRER